MILCCDPILAVLLSTLGGAFGAKFAARAVVNFTVSSDARIVETKPMQWIRNLLWAPEEPIKKTPDPFPAVWVNGKWDYNITLTRESEYGVGGWKFYQNDLLVSDVEYWRHETTLVYIKLKLDADLGWVWGSGTPAFTRGDVLAWRFFDHEKGLPTYYCIMVDCEMMDGGYYKCETVKANMNRPFWDLFEENANRYTYLKPFRVDCPHHVYVKDLCPTIVPRTRKTPVCLQGETSRVAKHRLCVDEEWWMYKSQVHTLWRNVSNKAQEKGRALATRMHGFWEKYKNNKKALFTTAALKEAYNHIVNATLNPVTTCECPAKLHRQTDTKTDTKTAKPDRQTEAQAERDRREEEVVRKAIGDKTCYVHEPWGFCAPVKPEETEIFNLEQIAGVRVCINSWKAPSCASDSRRGMIDRNRLRILWRDRLNKRPMQIPIFTESKTDDLMTNHGNYFYNLYECEYLIYNCDIVKFLGFAWDTSIKCSWILVGRTDYPKKPVNYTPEGCPPIRYDTSDESVYISFISEVSSYAPGQSVKTWGAGGPMKTSYDTCGSRECDFSCLKDPTTCLFKCCKNELFVKEFGDLPVREATFLTDNSEDFRYSVTAFRDVCLAVGYLKNRLIHLEETIAYKQQQVANTFLVTLKLMTTPPFSLIAHVSPVNWLCFGVGVAVTDWIVAHYSVTGFHAIIDEFRLYDGYPLALLDSTGINLFDSPDDGSANSISCKLAVGFIFVFLQSLVKCLAALLGQAMMAPFFMLGVSKEDVTFEIFAEGAVPARIFEIVGTPVRATLDALGVGQKIREFFEGHVLGWLFGGVLWQIHNKIGYEAGHVLASTFIARLFKVIMTNTGLCKRDGPMLKDWGKVMNAATAGLDDEELMGTGKEKTAKLFAKPTATQKKEQELMTVAANDRLRNLVGKIGTHPNQTTGPTSNLYGDLLAEIAKGVLNPINYINWSSSPAS